MTMVEPFGLAPEEAIRFLEAKGFRIGFDWRDVFGEENALAFTVAKVAEEDLLADIRAEVQRALDEGTTLADFRKRLTPYLQSRGWWGRREVTDPVTGEVRTAQLGSAHRLKLIYDTNLRTAHAAGKWARIERLKESRPYLRYVATLDERTRDRHAAWHDTVLPVDHPFWRTHYPPNGWNCRCSVQQLSARDLERFGLAPSDAPEVTTRPWTNARTGEVREVPDGIDPGFDHNVGLEGRDPRR